MAKSPASMVVLIRPGVSVCPKGDVKNVLAKGQFPVVFPVQSGCLNMS